MKSVICLLCLLSSFKLFAQGNTQISLTVKVPFKKDTISVIILDKTDSFLIYQTIRGQVFDAETRQPLEGASVVLDGLSNRGANADEKGNFVIKNVRMGRHNLLVTYVGYKAEMVSTLVSSSKETILNNINLQVWIDSLLEVPVNATTLAPIGSSAINASELGHQPGTRGELIRMVAVKSGSINVDDSRNDIIVRGNSPQSIQWRIEGINVPNPNHFNMPGTSGGPVTIINDKMLDNSNFYSGAFPAEFGNSTSGIFDLKFRKGNDNTHTGRVQFGLLGLELSGDGPIVKKKGSSYLFSVRRSTIDLLNALQIKIGTEAIPYYTDLSFKLNFPTKRSGNFSIFGMGGTSNIDILISKHSNPSRNLYGEKDRDQYLQTDMGVFGVNFNKTLKSTGFISGTIAFSSERIDSYHEFAKPDLFREKILTELEIPDMATLPAVQRYNFQQQRISGLLYGKRHLGGTNYLTAGISFDYYFLNFRDSAMNIIDGSDDFTKWRKRWWSEEAGLLIQPYIQWKHSSPKWDVVTGLHSQAFTLTNSVSWIEPRISLQYHLNELTTLTGAFGMHSQMQQPYLYFYGATNDDFGNPIAQNRNMDFTRSYHSALGIEKLFPVDSTSIYRLKIEAYYQGLYNVPIDSEPSSFSMLNAGAEFLRLYPENVLVNEGTGRNYGIELTFEKSFSRGYLFLLTGSLYESKYRGSDNVWRDTDFNGNYIVNALVTREWSFKRNVLSVGAKFTTAGGRRYGEFNMEASNKARHVVYYDSGRNSNQFPAYYRFDLRMAYKINSKKVSHEFVVDLVNVLNIKNVFRETYIPGLEYDSGTVEREYQLGLLPFFYYRIEFPWK